MTYPLRLVFSCFIIVLCFQTAIGQILSVSGKLLEKDTQIPVCGAYVSFMDSSTHELKTVVSDKKGKFIIENLYAKHNYVVKITFLGYATVERKDLRFNSSTDIGILFLTVQSNNIDEVVVKKVLSLAIQKGDTTEMNASTFKTHPDATADDLIKKMPGISVENGTLKAHGEEVLKIQVDGKDFFGDDPSIALNNLPADIIDKVQVFDKLSEQAQFTGFDDGQAVKTINIITKPNRKNSEFGKFYAGYDMNHKYIAGGNLHLFNSKTRISLLGLSNNINQQNFSSQDLIGVSLSKNDSRSDGFSVGQQIGVITTNALGLNIITSVKKINITGSYFFNITRNVTDQTVLKDKFLAPRPDHFSNEADTISGWKINHRFNFRMEVLLDSSDMLVFIPKLSFQSGDIDKLAIKNTSKYINSVASFVNASSIASSNNNATYNLAGEVVYRHKFRSGKRSVSLSLNGAKSNKQSDSYQIGTVEPIPGDILNADQYVNTDNQGNILYTSLVYIEPLGNKSMLYFNYLSTLAHTEKNKETYSTDDHKAILVHLDSLSNVFTNDYINNRIGMSYRIKSKKLKLAVGADYQHAVSKGNQVFPGTYSSNKPFYNWLPAILIQVKQNQKNNLKFYYRTSTNEPSISQLQGVIDNSQRSELGIGNPNLAQEYIHTLTCNYFFGNPDKKMNYSLIFSGKYTKHYIGNQIYTAINDTLLGDGMNVFLLKNNQLFRPVNIDHAITMRTVFSLGLPVTSLLCNINYFTGFNYAQTPGYIDSRLNVYSLFTITEGVQVSSNISEKIDYNVSYSWNYSRIINSALSNYANDMATYHYQVINAKITNAIGRKWVMQHNANAQLDFGFKNFNQNTVVWNFYVARKIGSSNQGEIRFSVLDALNKNKNIMHNVTPQYVTDSNSNTLHRYVMVMFTYNLNTMVSPAKTNKYKTPKVKSKQSGF